MKIILIEKIKKLGNIGDSIIVKDGYARNYLLIRNKALRYTKQNIQKFEEKKKIFIQKEIEKKEFAIKQKNIIKDINIIIIKQASEDNKIYGSISSKEICIYLKTKFNIDIVNKNIIISTPIKKLGIYNIDVILHSDIIVTLNLIVAKSNEEGEKISNEIKNEKNTNSHTSKLKK